MLLAVALHFINQSKSRLSSDLRRESSSLSRFNQDLKTTSSPHNLNSEPLLSLKIFGKRKTATLLHSFQLSSHLLVSNSDRIISHSAQFSPSGSSSPRSWGIKLHHELEGEDAPLPTSWVCHRFCPRSRGCATVCPYMQTSIMKFHSEGFMNAIEAR